MDAHDRRYVLPLRMKRQHELMSGRPGRAAFSLIRNNSRELVSEAWGLFDPPLVRA
jgi:hypothetical protein